MLWGSHVRQAYDVMERSTHENECLKTSTVQRARTDITVHTRNVAQTQRTARKMTGTDTSSRISDEIFELSLQTFASSH